MADLVRIASNDISATGDDVEQGFTNDDADIKNLYTISNKLRGLYYGATAPQSPNLGDVWQKSTDGKLYRWNGTDFIEITFPANGGNADTATTATNATNATNAANADEADVAVKLKTARKINGVDFDGTADISITKIGANDIATVNQTTYVVASGSGSNYYWRKWSDGVIEQWGTATIGGDTNLTVNFLTPYTTFCQVQLTEVFNNLTEYNFVRLRELPTLTSFIIQNASSSSIVVCWEAKGV